MGVFGFGFGFGGGFGFCLIYGFAVRVLVFGLIWFMLVWEWVCDSSCLFWGVSVAVSFLGCGFSVLWCLLRCWLLCGFVV